MQALYRWFISLVGIAVLAGCASGYSHTTTVTTTWGGGVPSDYYRDVGRIHVQPPPVVVERRIVTVTPPTAVIVERTTVQTVRPGQVARVTTSEDVCIESRSGGYCIYQPLYHQNVLVESRWVWVPYRPRGVYTFVPAREYVHSSHGRLEWHGEWRKRNPYPHLRPRSDVGCVLEEGCAYWSSIDASQSIEDIALLQ